VGNEHFDAANGVSTDARGHSLATLDVFVEQGENLPYRDPRTGDMVRGDPVEGRNVVKSLTPRYGLLCLQIDPYVRVFLRSASVLESTDVFRSDQRIADRNPVWQFRCHVAAVPSIQRELGVQVVDTKREEVAGEVTIPLRSLLDQKRHDKWHVMPPTLRQQLLEKQPRDQPARVRICTRLTHTKVRRTRAAGVRAFMAVISIALEHPN
jgi:hypothetical protein